MDSPLLKGVSTIANGVLNGQARGGFPPFCRRLGAGGHPLAFTTKRRRPVMNCLLKGGRGDKSIRMLLFPICVSVPCCPRAVGGNVLEGEILYALAFPPSWSVCRSPEAEAAVVSFFPSPLPRNIRDYHVVHNRRCYFPTTPRLISPQFSPSLLLVQIYWMAAVDTTRLTFGRGGIHNAAADWVRRETIVCLDRRQGSRYIANLNHGELEINEPRQFVKVKCAGV